MPIEKKDFEDLARLTAQVATYVNVLLRLTGLSDNELAALVQDEIERREHEKAALKNATSSSAKEEPDGPPQTGTTGSSSGSGDPGLSSEAVDRDVT